MARERKGSSSTLADEVYAQIKADVIEGRLRPGERLTLTPLCQRFGVSLSVVREALTRLAEQKLARATPQQGFMVTPVSAQHLTELTEARLEIEIIVLRRALAQGDLNWEGRVLAGHHLLANTPTGDPDPISPAWTSAHRDFHAAVASGCANTLLLQIRQDLYDSAELYRTWSAHASLRSRDIVTEHRLIAEAVVARNHDLAVHLMREHLTTTTRLVLDRAAEDEPVPTRDTA
jgi:DNA-binding GntR family transcriptional regulator